MATMHSFDKPDRVVCFRINISALATHLNKTGFNKFFNSVSRNFFNDNSLFLKLFTRRYWLSLRGESPAISP